MEQTSLSGLRGRGSAARRGPGATGPLWRVAACEALGAALLVLFSCLPSDGSGTHRALAAGLVVAMLVQCFDHISGAYYNPAVTLAAVVWGRTSAARGLILAGAQLAGAAVGALTLRGVRPSATGPCVTLPGVDVEPLGALALEAAATACLALANCGAWDARTVGRSDSWPLRIGAAVAGLSLAAGSATGASMNPARSFGPALCAGDWAHHWVYWLGPLAGALAGAALYVLVWRVETDDDDKTDHV